MFLQSQHLSKNTYHPFKDLMVDIPSLNTSVSGLTSSVNLHNSDEIMHATTAAKIIVQSLELLTSSEQQERAFIIAIGNLLFRNLVTKFNHPPRVTQPVMPAETLGARRIQAYRTKQSAVDAINPSMSSCST